jgi:hypothetical protein
MLLPHMQLRKLWLRRALRDYPLYDPPHKVEERLLSRDKATENFDYFMRVRQERRAFFENWLRRYFSVALTPDEKGVGRLNRWGNKYAGLLFVVGPDGDPADAYFTYSPPWTGENAGYNALFDMGIALGEIIIANCPKLRWDVDPISAILPRTAKQLKQAPGMSFQRPVLTGFDDPTGNAHPLHNVWGFAFHMLVSLATFKGMARLYHQPRAFRRLVEDELLNTFNAVLRGYRNDDPDSLRKYMPAEEYLKFIDSEEADDDK